ncbi:hypothetical protein [Bacillus sp. E214]|uniref:hypothetical protein n=1 Tax=Bacillus sp. E214 TaxID=2587156 RepID=UPI0011DF4905|nr:hypothetical protein [Bacillus sp. E214]
MQPVINIDSWINKLAYSKVSTGFRDGQIFAGKITKFYPHNMAEVLVNGTKMIAKLDVSVEAHVRQLFQVRQTENGLMQLKVLPFGSGISKPDLPAQLLSAFQIKASRAGGNLAEMVIANQLAVTKDSFTRALNWLNSTGDPSIGMPTIKLAYMNQLPIHKTVLDALLSLKTGESLTSMLDSLTKYLKTSDNLGKYAHIINRLEEFLQTGKREAFQGIAMSLMDENMEIFQKAGLILKEGEVILSNSSHNRLQEWIERVFSGNSTRPPELTAEEWQKVQEKILKSDLFSHLDKNNTLYKAMNSIMQSLGIKDQSKQPETSIVKDTLIQLTAEKTPIQLKNQAEAILTRLAAFQLLSQETGPLQNVFMQIPVPLTSVKGDLTLQWTGRKREDGTIDPAYCRIVFYLELAHLKETVIDMNIQNRIISLKIWTGEKKEANIAASSLVTILKENLEEKGYILSTVKIADFSQEKSVNSEISKSYYPSFGYTGVDYKI